MLSDRSLSAMSSMSIRRDWSSSSTADCSADALLCSCSLFPCSAWCWLCSASVTSSMMPSLGVLWARIFIRCVLAPIGVSRNSSFSAVIPWHLWASAIFWSVSFVRLMSSCLRSSVCSIFAPISACVALNAMAVCLAHWSSVRLFSSQRALAACSSFTPAPTDFTVARARWRSCARPCVSGASSLLGVPRISGRTDLRGSPRLA
mmetsp:Transcript_29888/g.84208  ORF Transcript_29888/g.84208 Transcript_29888/m.84208 type:complete len:204 (-) Transcript_29888:652-1263(-)